MSMLSAKARPRRKPSSVPKMPTAAPLRKNTRMMAPRVAPMVRMIAMSRPLLFTSMVMPVMMLNAATTMIRVRIRNITLRSICSAAKKCELSCCQSTSRASGPSAGQQVAPVAGDPLGLVHHDLDRVHPVRQLEVGLRVGERDVDEAVVVFVHPDLEDRADGEGLDPRHAAEGRGRTLGRDQRDLAADAQPHPLRHPAADRGRARRVETGQRALLRRGWRSPRAPAGRPDARRGPGRRRRRRWRWPSPGPRRRA